jgi:dihydrofolate reductase
VEQLDGRRALRRRDDPRLKDEVDGDIYVSGSITLVRAMLADDLVDELNLFVYPLNRGPAAPLPRELPAVQVLARGLRVVRERRGVYTAYRPQMQT